MLIYLTCEFFGYKNCQFLGYKFYLMKRNRQFSDVRQSHSRVQSSHSRVNSSIGFNRIQRRVETPVSMLKKEQSDRKNINNQSILSNKNEINKVKKIDNEVNGLRQSEVSNSLKSQVNSEYVCVNCFNHDLCESKKRQRRQEKQRIRSAEKNMIFDFSSNQHSKNNQKVNQQYRSTLKANERLLQEHVQLKRKREQQKDHERYVYALAQSEFKSKLQENRANESARKQQWKRQLQTQIQQKKQSLKHQQSNQQYQIFSNVKQAKSMAQTRKKREQKYRNDLLQQIEADFIKKKKEEQNKKSQENHSFAMVQMANQRDVRIRQTAQKRKLLLLEEARQTNKLNQIKKKQEIIQKQRQKQWTEEERMAKQEQSFIKERQRQQRLDLYLKEIKSQMEFAKIKKLKQHAQLYTTDEKSIGLEFKERKLESKSCRSCEKKFPKTFLTKVKI